MSRGGGNQPSGGAAFGEQATRETMRDLNQLRQTTDGSSDIGADVVNVMRSLQNLNYTDQAEFSSRLNRQVIPQLERLELELRRKLDEKGDQVRSSGSDTVPAGFADSVAEYFRRLSKGK
jgi:hypothetical protein